MLATRAAPSLLWQLAVRDFRRRYVGSLLGWLWGVVHPLVLLVVYTFLFRFAFHARLPQEEATDSYTLFLLAGMVPWLLFSETVSRSASSVTDHASLVKRSVFPSQLLPPSVLVSAGIDHLLALAVLLIAAVVLGHGVGASLFLLPLYALPLGLLAVGLGWTLAALHVYFRDTAQILTVVLTAWFWATPVFLPESFYRGRVDFLLEWNPLRTVMLGYRGAILGGRLPTPAVMAGLVAASLLAFGLGWLIFRRAKRGFADVL